MDKLLFLSKRARTNLLTYVMFLKTRVWYTDENNENKISHILKYLQSTRDLMFNLELYGSGTIKWWVDATFVVHHEMRSHTGEGI